METQKRFAEKSRRISTLVNEVLRGEHVKDTLINSSYKFSGETAANYFSNARNNLHSDMAYRVFEVGADLTDLKILSGLKRK